MTNNDWRYLLWFGGFFAIAIIALIYKAWIVAGLFGIFVFLFIVHMTINLMSPISRNDALKLLKQVEGSKDNNYFIVGDEQEDYSEWDAFCDTPIINDRLLNSIRVKCHHLREASLSQGKSNDHPIAMSESVIKELRQYIRELGG